MYDFVVRFFYEATMSFYHVLLQKPSSSRRIIQVSGQCSLSPLEPLFLGHSPVSGKVPPGWTDCWLGRFGQGPWFLAGRRRLEDGQGGAQVPLEKEKR